MDIYKELNKLNEQVIDEDQLSNNVELSNSFESDIKKLRKNGVFQKLENELIEVVNRLASGNKLDNKYRDHKLSPASPKKYKGMHDFHLRGNIVVIYENNNGKIVLQRIGSHQNLNLTEDWCSFSKDGKE